MLACVNTARMENAMTPATPSTKMKTRKLLRRGWGGLWGYGGRGVGWGEGAGVGGLW